jgi:ATP-dependent RNA/DNA helicase IGHMBP2
MLLDTAGALMYESVDEQSENESKFNVGECDLVIQLLKELLSYGVSKPHIGVITPYNAQVNMIKKAIRHCPELHN